MANLSIAQSLPAYVPVRNPAWIGLRANSWRISAGSQAIYSIHVYDIPGEGDRFEMIMPDGMIVSFVFAVDEDDSGTQIRIGTGGVNGVAQWLAFGLRTNIYLLTKYDIEWEDGSAIVTIRPRDIGSSHPVTLSEVTAPIVMVTNTPGSDPQFAPHYSANVQVWWEERWGSDVWIPRPVLSKVPDEDRHVSFNLRGMLQWATQYNWPNYRATLPQLQRNMQRRFKVARWEQFGDPPFPQRVIVSEPYKAWYGGSRNAERQGINELLDILVHVTNVAGGNPFLTWRGRAGMHEVSTVQQHYLAWFRRVDKVADQQLQLRVIVYYSDGTSESTIVWTDTNTSGWNKNDVLLFPTGFDILELGDLQPLKRPIRYTAQVLTHTSAALSEVHTFHLVDQDHDELHIEYINSLGVVDSVRTTGSWVTGLATEHEDVVRMRTTSGAAHTITQRSDAAALLRGVRPTRKVSTGFMDPGELNAVLDILFSPEHRLLDHERKNRAPMILVDAEHVTGQSGAEDENLAALNLEFIEGDNEMAWSDRVAMPPVPPTIGDPPYETG